VTPESREWTRAETIAHLRIALLERCGEDRTMCRAAAEEGIFCHGFRRWPESEFHQRWKDHIGVSTHLTRNQMEELANLWQLSEQLRRRDALICDAQTICPGACRGWNEFTDADLERFCQEILGKVVHIGDETNQIERIIKMGIAPLDTHPPTGRRLAAVTRVGDSPVRGEEET
jgi:hypothetical protein